MNLQDARYHLDMAAEALARVGEDRLAARVRIVRRNVQERIEADRIAEEAAR